MTEIEDVRYRIERAEKELAAAKSQLALLESGVMEVCKAYVIGTYGRVLVGKTDLGTCTISVDRSGEILISSKWGSCGKEKAEAIKAEFK